MRLIETLVALRRLHPYTDHANICRAHTSETMSASKLVANSEKNDCHLWLHATSRCVELTDSCHHMCRCHSLLISHHHHLSLTSHHPSHLSFQRGSQAVCFATRWEGKGQNTILRTEQGACSWHWSLVEVCNRDVRTSRHVTHVTSQWGTGPSVQRVTSHLIVRLHMKRKHYASSSLHPCAGTMRWLARPVCAMIQLTISHSCLLLDIATYIYETTSV